MILILLLLSESAVVAPAAAPEEAFDLNRVQPTKTCIASSTSEIVVCGRTNPDRYRVKPIEGADRYDRKAQRAEVGIGEGTSLAAETEAANVGGFSSKRMMVRLKLEL